MLEKTEGIVLKTTRFGETSIIAKIFTKKYGLISFMLKGIRSQKATKTASLIQPLQMLQLDISVKDNRNLQHIKEYRSDYIYRSLHLDFSRQALAVFCLEILLKCLKEHEINERVYDYFISFLLELDQTAVRFENQSLFFLLELSGLLGFEPSLQHISDYSYFNLASGKFEHQLSSTEPCLDTTETNLFKRLLAEYYEKNDIPFTGAERKILLDKLLLYFRWHIPEFTQPQSPAILHEVLK